MELPFVGGNGVVKKPKNPGMFLMVSYMFQKYASLAYDIYDDCLCHIWRWLVSYMALAYVIYGVGLCLTCCSKEPYVTFN